MVKGSVKTMISRLIAGWLLLFLMAGHVQSQSVDIESALQALDADIALLEEFGGRIQEAPEASREALMFRQDELNFSALMKLDELVREVAESPEDDPLRADVKKRLSEDLADAGPAVLKLVERVNQRLETQLADMENLSGSSLVVAQAHIDSLESMRIKYYGGLVDVVEGRKLLGLPADDIASPLRDELLLQADSLSGDLEFNGELLDNIQGRLQGDASNADLQAAATEMGLSHQRSLGQLEEVSGLLERLGHDVAPYSSVLLKQGESLSLKTLESGVVVSLARDAWSALRDMLAENGPDILLRVLIFVAIILVFRVLSRLTRRAVSAACDRPGVDMSTLLKDVLVSVSSGTVMAIGFLMALSQIGISLGPMLAGLGVAGFVVGFALQDTLGNFAAGGMILIYRPYDVDDFVEVAGASGLVKKMSLVSTTITTFDNQTLVIPNSKIWGDVIKNVTAQKLRRVDLEFGIGYGDDVEFAERVLNDILDKHDMVLAKPEALVKVHALADSSVNFIVRPWVRTEDYWDVYWDITREVKLRFDREGISIPFPQRDIHVFQESS
jgi:small conductance mechanosensitive channel